MLITLMLSDQWTRPVLEDHSPIPMVPGARGGARPLTLGAVAGSKQGLLVLTVICKKDEKACEDINSSSDIRGGRVGGGLGPLTVP